MMEDRTLSLIYHLGFSSEDNWQRISQCEEVRAAFRTVTGLRQIKNGYKLDKLEEKIRIIRTYVNWAELGAANSEYEKNLLSAAKNLDLIPALDTIKAWKDKRNDLMHNLFEMPGEQVSESLAGMAEEGLAAVRVIDKAVSRIKRKSLRRRNIEADI
jgi:hypothetical protein